MIDMSHLGGLFLLQNMGGLSHHTGRPILMVPPPFFMIKEKRIKEIKLQKMLMKITFVNKFQVEMENPRRCRKQHSDKQQ